MKTRTKARTEDGVLLQSEQAAPWFTQRLSRLEARLLSGEKSLFEAKLDSKFRIEIEPAGGKFIVSIRYPGYDYTLRDKGQNVLFDKAQPAYEAGLGAMRSHLKDPSQNPKIDVKVRNKQGVTKVAKATLNNPKTIPTLSWEEIDQKYKTTVDIAFDKIIQLRKDDPPKFAAANQKLQARGWVLIDHPDDVTKFSRWQKQGPAGRVYHLGRLAGSGYTLKVYRNGKLAKDFSPLMKTHPFKRVMEYVREDEEFWSEEDPEYTAAKLGLT